MADEAVTSQPVRTNSEPDDNRSTRFADARSMVWQALRAGVPLATILRKTLRVGAGSLATFDGFDGYIVADGAQAAFVARDRTTASSYLILYKSGTVRISTQEAGADILAIDAATGVFTQPVWTAPTLLNAWVNFGAPYANAGYRLAAATNEVLLRGLIKSGTTTGGTVLLNLPANYRPPSQVRLLTDSNGGVCELQLQTNGDVVIVAGASAAYLSLDGIRFPLT